METTNGTNSKEARKIPRSVWNSVFRKLDQLNAAIAIPDLKALISTELFLNGLTTALKRSKLRITIKKYLCCLKIENQLIPVKFS